MAKKSPATAGSAKPAEVATAKTRVLKPHELLLSPTVQSAIGIEAWGRFAGTVELSALVDDLRQRVNKVQAGDMQPIEAMLLGQAMTLETMFTSLARRATSQEYVKQFQVYLSMALKAQAQCRATLEALAEIKNPRPVAFVKQANISGGHQQVNNLAEPAQRARSVEEGGGVECLPSPTVGTGPYPIQTKSRPTGAAHQAENDRRS